MKCQIRVFEVKIQRGSVISTLELLSNLNEATEVEKYDIVIKSDRENG